VLGNLLTNAARYTPTGGRIGVTAEREGGDVLIRVTDNGIGLALARALVEIHGGSIEARSAGPGLGSEFIVRLALAK
jgi:signal transduction histidine kinase